MTIYIIKLLILLPAMGGLIFGALWIYRKYQPALIKAQNKRCVKMIETVPLGNFAKLAVVEFEGKKILLSVARNRVSRIAESEGTL